MTIRLLEGIQLAGIHQAIGSILTLAPDVEARHVSSNKAAYTTLPDIGDDGVPVIATKNVTGRIEKAAASGRDMFEDMRVNAYRGKSAGAVMVDWDSATLGGVTSGWTVAKDTSNTFAGRTTLKVTATAGAADTMTCDMTIPATYFGGAKRLGFCVRPGDAALAANPTLLASLWAYYTSDTLSHRFLSYANDSHAVGDWAEGYQFDQDATGTGHTSGTVQWAAVAAETTTRIRLVVTKAAGIALDVPLFIGPMVADPIEILTPTLTLFMDGQYTGQYNFARQILGAWGLRASLATVFPWIAGPTAGTMTEAQLLKMYELGHELVCHTGTAGDYGWDNKTKYPDGSEYSLVKADIEAAWAWMDSRNANRGKGYGVVGFTNGLVNTQSLTRRTNISNAIRDAGIKRLRQLGGYQSSFYGAARESCIAVTPSQLVTSSVSTATATGIIDQIIARGGWSALSYHNIVLSGASGNNVNVADFETVINYIGAKVAAGTLRVLPFSEAMREIELVNLPA